MNKSKKSSDVTEKLMSKKSPYAVKHEDRFKQKSFGHELPLRPINVLDFSPHPSKDVFLLYEFYFPQSAAERKEPSLAEMTFIQRKLAEKSEEREKEKKEIRTVHKKISSVKNRNKEGDVEEDNYNEGYVDENSYHLPPLYSDKKASSLPKMSSDVEYSTSQRSSSSLSPSPFRSVSESKESAVKKREWKHMTPAQKKLFKEYIGADGKDWRDAIRDEVWKQTLDRIDNRVQKSDDTHVLAVVSNAKDLEDERRRELIAVQEEKDARQRVAQQNRLTPTQIRKLAIIATKEWKKYDYARKKAEREEREEMKRRKINEANQEEENDDEERDDNN